MGTKPEDERQHIAAFLEWWSKDQLKIAYQKRDNDEHFEFYHRAQALADAAKAVREGDDARWAEADAA